jgi:Peptidase A4 family
MRRRWPVLAATIPLLFGWALAAAYPAAASTGIQGPGGLIQPGGPISQLSQAGGPTPGSGAPTGTVTPQVSGGQSQIASGGRNTVVSSSNWAGYAATGATFTSVSANWTQPAGHCTGGNQYAAFWVGLDGYSSSTVEQTGSEVDCAGRTPQYYAWYEVYPGASVTFTNPVSPGDQFSGSVTYASGTFKLVLKDITKNWTQTASANLAGAALSSAEAIAEAPCCTARGGTLPLTNFGTVSFSSAIANGKSMATFNPVEITMPNTSVSAMNSAGNFTVSYTGYSGFPWPFGWPGGF